MRTIAVLAMLLFGLAGAASASWTIQWQGNTATVTSTIAITGVNFNVDNGGATGLIGYAPAVQTGAVWTASLAFPNVNPNTQVPICDGATHRLWAFPVGGVTPYGYWTFSLQWKWPAVKAGFEGCFDNGFSQGSITQNRAFLGAIYDLQPVWTITAPTAAPWTVQSNLVTNTSLALTSVDTGAYGGQRILAISPNGQYRTLQITGTGPDSRVYGVGAILGSKYSCESDGSYQLDLQTMIARGYNYPDVWGPCYQDSTQMIWVNTAHVDGPAIYVKDGAINLSKFGTAARPPATPMSGDASTLVCAFDTGLNAYSTATGVLLWNMPGTVGNPNAYWPTPYANQTGIVTADGVVYAAFSGATAQSATYNLYRSGVKILSGSVSNNYTDFVSGTTSYTYEASAIINGIEGPRSNVLTYLPPSTSSVPPTDPTSTITLGSSFGTTWLNLWWTPTTPSSNNNTLRAIDLATGVGRWSVPSADVPTAVADGRVYCANGGRLACYSLTGALLWSRAGSYQVLGYAALSKTVIALNGPNYEVLRGDTGATIWTAAANPKPQANLVGFQGNRMYVGSGASVYCLESPCVLASGPPIPVGALN